jgi:hypothetical protein
MIEEGFCACGCGQRTPIIQFPENEIDKGRHWKCLRGHRITQRGLDKTELMCNTCFQVLPVSHFSKRTKTTYAGKCKECSAHRNRQKQYARFYGATEQEIEQLKTDQRGRCAICSNLFSDTDKARRMCVDHNHETKKIRGLLCHSCNSGLGLLGDRSELLRFAILYLERNSC